MNRYQVSLIILILAGLFLRVFWIDKYPVQLNHDEISQLYDAISIAQTGKDIYGNFMPTMFISINDFKSPFCTYATSLVYLLFGDHEWIIKIPGILFSILTIPAIYWFVKSSFKNQTIAILASALTVITPFEIFYGRKSFESTIGICLLLVGFTGLCKYLSNKKVRWLYLGFITLAVAMYTYFSHAIIIPLLLLIFIWLNKNTLWPERKKILPVILMWVVLIIPIISIVVLNPDSRYRSETVFIIQDPVLGEKIHGLSRVERVLTITSYSLTRYLEQFNPEYLFLRGLDLTNQGPLGSGPLMAIQLPFILVGIYYIIKNRDIRHQRNFILAWILIGMLPSGLTFEKFSPHRSIMVFTMLNILCAIGIWQVISWSRLKNLNIRLMGIVVITILFTFNFLYFLHIYIVDFPNEKSQEIHYPFKQIAEFTLQYYDSVEQIVFDPKFGEIAPRIGTASHYYLAYYIKYPPVQFQKEYRLGNKSRETLFGKYSIRAVNWGEDRYLKNALIIASPWSLNISSIEKTKIIKTFYFYNGSVAFYALKV
ncbi:hypothetical protein A3C32_04495 [Candidatus Daviesbacteria bacterium RIFCSPHIGHO2_02_FULL_41_14]|uniref:Glycosyltransferase RgtA/B/C/D-like domain-containing protein n=1 Tax=Candidatus Daviesbacteria bacterium RIFCSPLOWO2_01_FULL_40_24 TaxID=1797787 RepID=A0A1F5MJC3_9BACT|nr:MAG: hypothetical protein A3C32_04495 [Candidatus Daviesbacteria bacterium RIFCSPHIGHO2_02_FULL_41_14]OGE65486.1 MAG: hypothetical protein A3B49_01190 [Candidatus Daviesbacteria bacterium RIFCSPLOWO2_01_FULL_40_24]